MGNDSYMIDTEGLIAERYELSHLLGVGGMGRVYLARDRSLSREVALKVLEDRHAENPEFVERFRREAKAAASLSHPNMVAVYDAGEDGETPYIAMEYVPGGTLKNRIQQRGALLPRVAAGVAFEVANALAAAHEKGIVHRDIKPENVLVTDQGHSKVGDFGIARAATATAITETSLILGSVRYLSPEQAKGEVVGPPSDLYSLGVVLYEMLTGRVPFDAENPVATAMKHVTEEPALPRGLDPTIPEALEAITLKLLKKDPKQRYESAAELAEDLQRLLVGLIPAAASDSSETMVDAECSIEGASERRSRRKSRAALALQVAATSFVLLVSGLGFGRENPLAQLIGQGRQGPISTVSTPAPSGAGNVALKAPERPEIHALQQETLQQKSPPPLGEGQSQEEQNQQPRQQTQAAPRPVTERTVGQISAQTSAPSPAPKLDQKPGPVSKSVRSQDVPRGLKAQPGATVAVTLSSGPLSTSQGGMDEQDASIQARVSTPSSSVSTTTALSDLTNNTRAWVARNNSAIGTAGMVATSRR